MKTGKAFQRRLILFFLIFFSGCILLDFAVAMSSGGKSLSLMFFHTKSSGRYDHFMDFFNSIRSSSHGDVYSARNSIYPPLAVLVFRLLGHFINPDVVGLAKKYRWNFQFDSMGLIVYIVFTAVCLALLFALIYRYLSNKDDSPLTKVFSLSLIFCYPILYCIDRGNIVMLTVFFSMIFILYRDSKNKAVRELSYICLAVAAGLKIYPAAFGMLLIIEEKYKEALRTVLYGIAFTLIPLIIVSVQNAMLVKQTAAVLTNSLLAIGAKPVNHPGLPLLAADGNTLTHIFENIQRFFKKRSQGNNFGSVSSRNFAFYPLIQKLFPNHLLLGGNIFLFLFEGIALFDLFYTESNWKKTFLLCYLFINIPGVSSVYSLVFLLIPFIEFIVGEHKNAVFSYIYTFLFAALFTPLPLLSYEKRGVLKEILHKIGFASATVNINKLFMTVLFQAILILITIEMIKDFTKKSKPNPTLTEASE